VKVAVLLIGAALAGAAVVVVETHSNNDELVAPVERKPRDRDVSTTSAARPAVSEEPNPTVATVDSPVEREPGAIRVQNNLFRAIEKPAPPPAPRIEKVVEPPPPIVPPKPPFTHLGSVMENGELQAIAQLGEAVIFVKLNQEIAGFRVERIDERGISLIEIKSGLRAQVLAKNTR
jgi:acyl-CoA synthetase (AMP-forming)/AMP-acid ligase II